MNQQINLTNYCGREKTLSPLQFQHCGGEGTHCPHVSDTFGVVQASKRKATKEALLKL